MCHFLFEIRARISHYSETGKSQWKFERMGDNKCALYGSAILRKFAKPYADIF